MLVLEALSKLTTYLNYRLCDLSEKQEVQTKNTGKCARYFESYATAIQLEAVRIIAREHTVANRDLVTAYSRE